MMKQISFSLILTGILAVVLGFYLRSSAHLSNINTLTESTGKLEVQISKGVKSVNSATNLITFTDDSVYDCGEQTITYGGTVTHTDFTEVKIEPVNKVAILSDEYKEYLAKDLYLLTVSYEKGNIQFKENYVLDSKK